MIDPEEFDASMTAYQKARKDAVDAWQSYQEASKHADSLYETYKIALEYVEESIKRMKRVGELEQEDKAR